MALFRPNAFHNIKPAVSKQEGRIFSLPEIFKYYKNVTPQSSSGPYANNKLMFSDESLTTITVYIWISDHSASCINTVKFIS